jgi:F-type H+-transporting ATPase subunit b
MSINITLLGQMITFALLVAFTMRFVWPPLSQAMAERQKKIAEGLADAERGREDLKIAQKKAAEMIAEARSKAAEIMAHAEKTRDTIIAEARHEAEEKAAAILKAAEAEVNNEYRKAQTKLRQEAVDLGCQIAEQILKKEVDRKAHEAWLNRFLEKSA